MVRFQQDKLWDGALPGAWSFTVLDVLWALAVPVPKGTAES